MVTDFYALRKDVELAVERVDEVRRDAGLEQLVEEIASLENKSVMVGLQYTRKRPNRGPV